MLEYIRRIAVFIIIEGVLLGIVTNEDYKKFIKMCSGMILVILVLSPLDQVFGFTDTIKGYFNGITNENQLEELKEVIGEASDEAELKKFKPQYESIIKEQLSQEVNSYGYVINCVEVTFDESQENYIGKLDITIGKESETQEESENNSIEKVNIVVGRENQIEQDNPEIMAIKNYITDTYGVDYEKIIIRRNP